MFQPTLLRCLMVAGLALATTSSMWAQTESQGTTQKPAAKKFRGRLPSGYGQLGITQKQRAEIYGIQERYHLQIEELETQLEALKAKQAEEIYSVLTPEQKVTLKTRQDKRKATASIKTPADEPAPEE